MATLPENTSVAIDELESAIIEMESRLESAHAERSEAKARQVELEIENANLRRELNLARDRQGATAGILKVIAGSAADVQPVFEAIVNSAAKLFEPCSATITTFQNGELHWNATAASITGFDVDRARSVYPIPFDPDRSPSARAILERRIIEIPDVTAPDTPEFTRKAAIAGGFRSITFVPLIDQEQGIGTIIFTHPQAGFRFSEGQLAIVQTFADQAMIAIQNARLFNETREALERQTATAEILKVIASSPSDVLPVFEAIVGSAKRLLGGFSAAVFRFIDGIAHLEAITPTNPAADKIMKNSFPRPIADFQSFAMAQAGRTVQTPDTEALSDDIRDIARARGFRSMLITPLLRERTPIGLISVTRVEPGPFSAHFVQLLQTFADQAVIAIRNVGLFNEVQARTEDLSESLRQQTSVGDVLKTISRSTFELQPVLDTLVNSAAQLCDADMAFIMRRVGDEYRAGAAVGYTEAYIDFLTNHPLAVDRGTVTGRAVLDRRPVQILDVVADPEYTLQETYSLAGQRTTVGVPLLRENEPIGVIVLARRRVEPFTQKQIDLVATFADQAVIAIENVRLFNEVHQRTEDLSEALQQQTATGEVLKVIASSPTDVSPALQAIVESACTFCNAYDAGVLLKIGDNLHFSAHHGPIRTGQQPRPINRDWVVGRSVVDKAPVQVSDFQALEAAEFPEGQRQSREQGHRCTLSVPLLREGEAIGAIALRRLEPAAFSDKQIALLQTFADQAVIAIGNVRLFEEVQAKTRDLTEALTYQTGSANILKVIASSPTDVAPVLKAIVESACELCEAYDSVALLKESDHLRFSAHHGPIPLNLEKWPINRKWASGRAFVDQKPVHVTDLLAEGNEFPDGREMSARMGHRTIVAVPLLREGDSIGALILRRNEVNPFSDKQIALLQTFADQAVIAIGNVHLFEEVQARTRELTESLEQQTATSEVLHAISSSQGDLAPVFDAMLGKSIQLCGANFGVLNTYDGSRFHTAATYGLPPAYDEFRRRQPLDYGPGTAPARLLQGEPHVEILHLIDSEAYRRGDPNRRALVDIGGARSLLAVPLLKDKRVVGNVLIFRQEDSPFSDKQIALLKQFAAQAVIAIENARLLNELRQRTNDLTESLEQQTATSEVLRVISSSSGDLQPVFKSMLSNALKICAAQFGNLLLFDGNGFTAAELHTAPPAYTDFFKSGPLVPEPTTALGRIVTTRQVVHIPDILAEGGGVQQSPLRMATAQILRARTLLAVPMLKESELVGTIVIYREEVRPFNQKQIDLVTNFANQAVIAIENARLLNQLRERTTELSQSLDNLRTAQDRLIQTEKLASLGQLTAGIAHEIKNPLNFVNNFSSLSSELIDELNDALKATALDTTTREEIDEVTQTLKSNLERVVLHGKRADSIVKNMLLHSREGGGEHRPSDINALVDESLNLAYHGARAERPGFNVTLERDFDPAAGQIDLFPQEITRVILNLVSNGFHAVTKRNKEGCEPGFEPTLRASTKNLGGSVEIRIRDNGTGIPPEVKEKMFNPFFTTKPAGEGTGLGLSMSHDIIVKQHGGTIDVNIEQGHFTEFRIVLPRTSNFTEKSRG